MKRIIIQAFLALFVVAATSRAVSYNHASVQGRIRFVAPDGFGGCYLTLQTDVSLFTARFPSSATGGFIKCTSLVEWQCVQADGIVTIVYPIGSPAPPVRAYEFQADSWATSNLCSPIGISN